MLSPFANDLDPERTKARRLEIRRTLEKIKLIQSRIKEIAEIMAKLDQDSDQAAEEHGVATAKLQAELDTLDAQHVDAILDGKESPGKSLTRRTEILRQIGQLNEKLELRCEANRRSKQAFQKQYNELRPQVTRRAELENELLAMAGPAHRVQSDILRLTIRVFESAVAEAKRSRDVHQLNYQREQEWDKANRRGTPSTETLIKQKQVDEANQIVRHFDQKVSEALSASNQHARSHLS